MGQIVDGLWCKAKEFIFISVGSYMAFKVIGRKVILSKAWHKNINLLAS